MNIGKSMLENKKNIQYRNKVQILNVRPGCVWTLLYPTSSDYVCLHNTEYKMGRYYIENSDDFEVYDGPEVGVLCINTIYKDGDPTFLIAQTACLPGVFGTLLGVHQYVSDEELKYLKDPCTGIEIILYTTSVIERKIKKYFKEN